MFTCQTLTAALIGGQVQRVQEWRGALWHLVHGSVWEVGSPHASTLAVEPLVFAWVHLTKALSRLLPSCTAVSGMALSLQL